MKRFLAPLLILMTMTGCQETDLTQLSPQERQAVSSLIWLKDADATQDAEMAIERGDKRLLAMATRGPNLPGVPTESVSKAKSVCGIRYVEGSTDTVMGDTHLKMLQRAQEYAEAYNQIILDYCLNADQ